jgi:hypothetical protein
MDSKRGLVIGVAVIVILAGSVAGMCQKMEQQRRAEWARGAKRIEPGQPISGLADWGAPDTVDQGTYLGKPVEVRYYADRLITPVDGNPMWADAGEYVVVVDAGGTILFSRGTSNPEPIKRRYGVQKPERAPR